MLRAPIFVRDSLLQKVLPPISVSLGFDEFGPAALFPASFSDPPGTSLAVMVKLIRSLLGEWKPMRRWSSFPRFSESVFSRRPAFWGKGIEKPKNAFVYLLGER